MSYYLRDDETLRDGLRRILCEQIDGAISATALSSENCSPVHETRKHLKKARAALVLLDSRHAWVAEEERQLQKIGRLISDIRDAEVRLQTIKQFRQNATERSNLPLHETEELLAFELDSFLAAFSNWQGEVAGKLRRSRERVQACALEEFTRRDICQQISETYRRGRRAAWKARRSPSVKSFHRLRKRTKTLALQLRILKSLHPAIFGEMTEELKRLGQHLGHAHDLSFVAERLQTLAGATGRKRGRRALEALLDSRQKDLRRTSVALAERFYSEKPSKFAARIADYFEEWERAKLRRSAELLAA